LTSGERSRLFRNQARGLQFRRENEADRGQSEWGEEGSDQIQLKKVQDHWKIIWEQEIVTGEAAA